MHVTPPYDPPSPRASLAGAPWGLVSYQVGDGPVRTGILQPDGVLDLGDLGSTPLIELLADWDRFSQRLGAFDLAQLPRLADVQLDVPLRLPPKLIFAGANYHAHIAEMGVAAPATDVRPYFFLKPPTTTVVADQAPVAIADDQDQIDWEAELAVVIGVRGRRIAKEDALDHVAGYLVVNDITDRSRLARSAALAPPFAFDWVSAKALDFSCPMSSAVVPAHLVPNPGNLRVRLWVNGELKQDATTADMVYDIPTLIAAASEIFTLEPGDVIGTGTPAGVGKPRNEFLAPGDRVVAEVSGVGRVENTIVTMRS